MIITGSFLIAFLLKNCYGDSMKFLDGTENTLFGLNIGIVGFGLALILLMIVILSHKKTKK